MRVVLAMMAMVFGFSQSSQALDFKDLNGVMWFYTSSENIKFKDITSKLDELKVSGVRVVVIYSPYHGDKNKWLGCAPVNFYDVSPQNGTMQDFLALVNGAHARGMKVVSYFTNIFIVKDSPFFQTAARQHKAGQHTAREASAVHWSATSTAPLPKPAAVVLTANDYTNVLKGKSSMDTLEEAFKRRDQARKMGKLTHAWTPIEGTQLVVQEAAVLAGGGILYGPATYADYKTWIYAMLEFCWRKRQRI